MLAKSVTFFMHRKKGNFGGLCSGPLDFWGSVFFYVGLWV